MGSVRDNEWQTPLDEPPIWTNNEEDRIPDAPPDWTTDYPWLTPTAQDLWANSAVAPRLLLDCAYSDQSVDLEFADLQEIFNDPMDSNQLLPSNPTYGLAVAAESSTSSFPASTSGTSSSVSQQELLGEKFVVCPHEDCGGKFVFTKNFELRKHMDKHERPHKCTVDGCPQDFSSKGDLKRHLWTNHQIDTGGKRRVFFCPESSCPRSRKSFPRKDNYVQHYRRRHGNEPENHSTNRNQTPSDEQSQQGLTIPFLSMWAEETPSDSSSYLGELENSLSPSLSPGGMVEGGRKRKWSKPEDGEDAAILRRKVDILERELSAKDDQLKMIKSFLGDSV